MMEFSIQKVFHGLVLICLLQFPFFSNAQTQSSDWNASQILKSFLCPENNGTINPTPWTSLSYFDRETSRCYKQETQGPCSKYELWWQETPDSEYGQCSCIAERSHCEAKFNLPIARSNSDHKCYPLYSDGNCNKVEGEWFTVNSNWEGTCTKNPCRDLHLENSPQVLSDVRHFLNMDSEQLEKYLHLYLKYAPEGVHPWEINKPTWYLHEGSCYMTFTQGHCPHGNQTALFSGTQSQPSCVEMRNADGHLLRWSCPFGHVFKSSSPRCPDGFRKYGSDCVPNYKSG